jgi:hypothetical protein
MSVLERILADLDPMQARVTGESRVALGDSLNTDSRDSGAGWIRYNVSGSALAFRPRAGMRRASHSLLSSKHSSPVAGETVFFSNTGGSRKRSWRWGHPVSI